MSLSNIQLKQIKSQIRRSHRQRETLIGLGLNRIGRVGRRRSRVSPSDECPLWGRYSITSDRRIFGVCNAPSLQSPISEWPLLVRSGHSPKPQGPLCAIRDPPQQISGYSMTSSALTNNVGGIVRPSIFAVRWLITISNFVGCSIGRSAGLAPLRIRST
jgi:Ribosomal protein L30p/L7e